MTKKNILALSPEELTREMEAAGEAPFRAKQLRLWFAQRYETDFEKMTDLSKDLRMKLASLYAPLLPNTTAVVESRLDASKKFLFTFGDGERAEAVRMRHDNRVTLCLSTQTGCALGCAFCLTGKRAGRNLEAHELIGQFLPLVQGLEAQRVNIVFMGMGEPLMNVENLAAALPFFYESISPRRITVSTAGVLKGIESLGKLNPHPKLALSLNAATDETRRRIMPVHVYTMHELMEAVDAYPRRRGERVTFEYVLLKGITDTDGEIRALEALLAPRRRHAKINLIPYNPVAGLPFQEPDAARVDAIGKRLSDKGFTVTVRRSHGRDIQAACGQLAAGGTDIS